MQKILTVEQAVNVSNTLHQENKTIVLVGGCFDLLHIGHIKFLETSKEQGDILMVLLESDETIKRLKGIDRPIHTQAERAHMLNALTAVDYIVLLPPIETNNEYDQMIFAIKPAIISTTKGDKYREHKVRQATAIEATVVDVIERQEHISTSKLIAALQKEL